MRKLQILGLALAAMFALSVVVAASAGATEYLVSGEKIAVGTNVTVDLESEGGLLLEDMNASGTPDILCEIEKSGGTITSGGLGQVTSGECKNPVVDSGTCGSPKVAPLNLPWTTELLEPEPGVFETDITKGTGGAPGWLAECTVLFVKVDDSCTTELGKTLSTNLEDGLVHQEFMEETPSATWANCSVGGEKQGLVVGLTYMHALNGSGELITLAIS
jgi:hypothetical protein